MKTLLMADPGMAAYGFMKGSAPGGRHGYGADRFAAFFREFLTRDWRQQVEIVNTSPAATTTELERFHTREYLEYIATLCALGEGSFDHGPTPVEPGIEQVAARVVGCVLHAARLLEEREDFRTSFVPVSGFHHAEAEESRDYCIYNDPGVLLSTWLADYPDEKIAYVDVDAHFGNGVHQRFEADPRVLIVDMHQDMRSFWYSDGSEYEPGSREEATCRLTSLQPGCGDHEFLSHWDEHFQFIQAFEPKRICLLAAADMLEEDGLGQLDCSLETLQRVCRDLVRVVESRRDHKMVVLGAGGYALEQIGPAWCGVLEALTGIQQHKGESR